MAEAGSAAGGVALHGTEMNMLEAITGNEQGTAAWAHREAWSGRLRVWAARADRLLVDSPADATRALTLFDVPAQRLVVVAPGSTTTVSDHCSRTVNERLAVLHHLLVDDPRAWDESGVVGSVRYTHQDLAAFADPDVPVLSCARPPRRQARNMTFGPWPAPGSELNGG